VKVGLPFVGFTLAVIVGSAGETLVVRLTDCDVPLTRETVTVEVVLLPCPTDPLVGFKLTEKSKGPGALNAATWLSTVFQFWKVELCRYSASSQKVDEAVAVGSVAAPK